MFLILYYVTGQLSLTNIIWSTYHAHTVLLLDSWGLARLFDHIKGFYTTGKYYYMLASSWPKNMQQAQTQEWTPVADGLLHGHGRHTVCYFPWFINSSWIQKSSAWNTDCNFPEPNVASLNIFFFSARGPKPKDSFFYYHKWQRNASCRGWRQPKCDNLLEKLLKPLIDCQNNWQLIFQSI